MADNKEKYLKKADQALSEIASETCAQQKKSELIEAIDARLSGVMPPLNLVTQWYERALDESRPAQALRLQAYEAYKKLNQPGIDKELARFMPTQIQWEDYEYGSLQNPLFNGKENKDFIHPLVDHVTREILTSASPLALLVAATFNKFQLIFIPRGVKSATLELATIVDSHAYSGQLIICVVEEGAQVSIYDKQDSRGMHARCFIGLLGAHSHVTYINDSAYGADSFGMSLEHWMLGENSHLRTIEGLTGGRQTWSFKDYTLEGSNAHIEHLSLAALNDREQAALITRQQHQAASTKSSVTVKTLLLGEAHSFYRGTITMNEDADKSDADQQQRALILSSLARTCAIPSLEIATHDVRCRHGSAAGRFNKEELWYLLSRGFDEQSAYALLIDGFYNDHSLIQENSSLLTNMIERMKKASL